ncbi:MULTISPECIES: hypothetical protein [unclassified Rhizobium]|jgi:hypothetical protein|uniref:hypothetical protein n=1 Tax=unclassified Rhizobium TaxID=2613769 RepID=UPI00064622A6|nr:MULTISPECIES: hypothetical protein [unclassified Rhizobium]OJY78549.1 MAG: hypothetical protein BGP09_01940 [Rhizobium sp. 60-20]RKD52030.1 hypothetical protein BJ928_11761 [Rhizobium sp. WW_1]
MTTIFHETLPVIHLTFQDEWRLDYDPAWEAHHSTFPTLRRVEELVEAINTTCEDIAPQIAAMAGDPTRVLERISRNVQKRCGRIQAQNRNWR